MFIQTTNFLSNDSESSWHQGLYAAEFGLDTGHCKAFMESKDVGRTLDLTALGSYEELYKKLANMFGIERSEILNHVLYHDMMQRERLKELEMNRSGIIYHLMFAH